jgi:hypothetical protein
MPFSRDSAPVKQRARAETYQMRLTLLAAVLCLTITTAAGQALAPRFSPPLACELGKTCFVQNWPDFDAGPGHADPTCGPLSYDGHDGTDFRVPYRDYVRGVAVLAPAAGRVTGVRDGEVDGLFLAKGRTALNGRDCGNGVALDHGGGWTSQVCHLKLGSLSVRSGDQVAAGQMLGNVGLSGHTQFPHVHLSVYWDRKKIDPSNSQPIGAASCDRAWRSGPGNLWTPAPAYIGTAVIDTGFAEAPPAAADAIDRGPQASGRKDAPALLGWALIMGPRAGDDTHVRLSGPNGAIVSESNHRHEKSHAQYALYVGKKRPGAAWPAGAYRLDVTTTRQGQVVASARNQITIR